MSRGARAFTILELVVVTSLLGLFFGAVYETLHVALRSVGAADRREQMRTQLVRVLDQFTREVRMARDVDEADDDDFQVDVDTDGNGSSSGTERDVNYVYDAANDILTRAHSGGSTVTLLRNLTAFDFDYYESNSSTLNESCTFTSSCGGRCCEDDVRVVIVTATVTSGSGQAAETITETASVFLGNM